MADLLVSRSSPSLVVSPMVALAPAAVRLALRGDAGAFMIASKVLALEFSALACRAAVGSGRAALWLGPDEQLVLLPETDGVLLPELSDALRGARHSLVDVTHRQIGLEVTGANAPALLNSACPLDLNITAFPVGMCTRTVLAKAEIVLWRTAPLSFRLEVWRSFAGYVSGLLAEAGREFAGSEA